MVSKAARSRLAAAKAQKRASNSSASTTAAATAVTTPSGRPLHSSILFPELEREINASPSTTAQVSGLFIVSILKNGKNADEWYLLFEPRQKTIVSRTRPHLPTSAVAKGKDSALNFPIVVLELEDDDLLNIVTGGLTGVKAYVTGRLKVLGDLQAAFGLEEVFVKTGGVDKTLKFIKDHNIKFKAAASSSSASAKL